MSRASTASLARLSMMGLVVVWVSPQAGCRDEPGTSGGSGGVAMGALSPATAPGRVGAGPAAAPRARPRPGPPARDAASGVAGKGLMGLWGLERVTVGGMSVPLPKRFRIRLRFHPGGRLVVIGVKGTKPTRTVGNWEVRGKRLLSTVDGKQEVRTFVLDGDRLTLTRAVGRRTIWHMKRLALPMR